MKSYDVIIVGAGLSGIGAANHLQEQCPGKQYAILESRDALGGTWDLFRYPGIRSDSDMYTLGYNFKPWLESKAIADGPSILNYVRETATENRIDKHILYNHRLRRATWSSENANWQLDVESADGKSHEPISCNFLYMCCGYYQYEQGYSPEFAGRGSFTGPVIHPQHWPEELNYQDKRVLVIGSGATAMTLVPAMADKAAHVTMVQRSPTYVISRPATDWFANLLRRILPTQLGYRIVRWRNVLLQRTLYRKSREKPEKLKAWLLRSARKALPKDYDFDTHFIPRYDPWDERMCLIPDSDLFKALSSGKASVVTGEIDCFTEQGLLMKSGEQLDADIIVTATGLNLQVLGGTEFSVDGQGVDFARTVSYKGLMNSDVPNMVQCFGYINASWTLRADLTSEFVCKLINHMDETETEICVPRLRDEDSNMTLRPWIDDFSPGYMARVMHLFPRQGDKAPWLNTQDYATDKTLIGQAELEDGVLTFRRADRGAAEVIDPQCETETEVV